MGEKGSITQCLGKKRYATCKYAEAQAEFLAIKYGKEHRVYACGICGGYHCTTKPR